MVVAKQAGDGGQQEVPGRILVEPEQHYLVADAVAGAHALPAAVPEPGHAERAPGPDDAVPVLVHSPDRTALETFARRIAMRGGAMYPADAARVAESDPQAAVLRRVQCMDIAFRELRPGQRFPADEARPVEAHESTVDAEPDVAVVVLGYGPHRRLRQAVHRAPGLVEVAVEALRRVRAGGGQRHQRRQGEHGSEDWHTCLALRLQPPAVYSPPGVYQIGELQARSFVTAGSGSGSPLASAR